MRSTGPRVPCCDLLDASTALAACCGFDLCHKYILYLYLYLYCDLFDAPTALAACCGFDLCHKYILYLYLYLARAVSVCDLLDAPTALAACCGFDLCHKYVLYLYLYLSSCFRGIPRFFRGQPPRNFLCRRQGKLALPLPLFVWARQRQGKAKANPVADFCLLPFLCLSFRICQCVSESCPTPRLGTYVPDFSPIFLVA